MPIEDIYNLAVSLDDNTLIVIKFNIDDEKTEGKIKISNSVKYLTGRELAKMLKLFKIIGEYATEYYYIPVQNSVP